VVKPGVEKSSNLLGLKSGTILGERGVTRISTSTPRTGGEKSIGTFLKFKVRENPIEGIKEG